MDEPLMEKKYSATRGTFEQFCADFKVQIEIPSDVMEATKQLLRIHGLSDEEINEQVAYAASKMTMNSPIQLLFYVYDKQRKGIVDEEGVRQLIQDQELNNIDDAQLTFMCGQLNIVDQKRLTLDEFERLYSLLSSTSENLLQYL